MRALVLSFVFGLVCGVAHATPTLAQLDAVAQGTHALTAQFKQTSRVKLFKEVLTQTGRLAFVAPRKIRWEYVTPDPSLLVLDGTKATMTSPGAAPQVIDLTKDATMSAIFDQLLTFVGGGSIASAEKTYDVVVSGSDRAPLVSLTPKVGSPADKVFAHIALTFDAHLNVSKIDLVEKKGDEKVIVFDKVERNGNVPASLFTL